MEYLEPYIYQIAYFLVGVVFTLVVQAIVRVALRKKTACPSPTVLLEEMVMTKLKSRLWVSTPGDYGEYAKELKESLESLNGKLATKS